MLNDPPQIVNKSHVHHGVGFVEHEIVEVLQVDEPLFHQVEQPTWGGNDDVDSAAKFLDLAVLFNTSKQGHRKELGVFGVIDDVLFDLGGQFPRWGQNEAPDRSKLSAVPLQMQAVDHGEAEGRGFSGSGLRDPEDVMTGEHFGNGLGLNGGWGFIAQRLDGLQYRSTEAQIVK